jgi:Protein of unknown function (DUF2510)
VIEDAMSPPAGWYPDPERGHQFRYYDGSLWTSHVSDNGVVTYAPVHAPGIRRVDGYQLTAYQEQAAYEQRVALGGLRPGGWLPEVPHFKMWALALLSPFLFWLTVNSHRLILPIGIPCAVWCWASTNDVLEAHRRANSAAVSEIRAARLLALALAGFGFVQFALWTH